MFDKASLTERTGKKVLLFSSGMDSYIINQLEKPDVLLFIDNKSNYSELEMKYLKSLNYSNLVFISIWLASLEVPRVAVIKILQERHMEIYLILLFITLKPIITFGTGQPVLGQMKKF